MSMKERWLENWTTLLPRLALLLLGAGLLTALRQLPYFNVYLKTSYCLVLIWFLAAAVFRMDTRLHRLIILMLFLGGGAMHLLNPRGDGGEIVSAGFYLSFAIFFYTLVARRHE